MPSPGVELDPWFFKPMLLPIELTRLMGCLLGFEPNLQDSQSRVQTNNTLNTKNYLELEERFALSHIRFASGCLAILAIQANGAEYRT